MVKEMLNKRQKSKILEKIFQDRDSDLRIFSVEKLIEDGKAQTFIEACFKIKAMEDKQNKIKKTANFIPEVAKDLYNLMGKDNITK